MMSGIPIVLLRICEPFVFEELLLQLSKLSCQKTVKIRRTVQYSKESLDSFLNSAINIEFVSLILQGVISSMD
jgi:hypothetical protein